MSRLTDYAIVMMTYLATEPERVRSAHEVAEGAHLRPPTVSKLLRLLTREGLLTSHRGVKGGYGLARAPDDITVAGIIRAIEGPIALTECGIETKACEHEVLCSVRGHWQRINLAVRDALESITLSDMASPSPLTWMKSTANRFAERAEKRH